MWEGGAAENKSTLKNLKAAPRTLKSGRRVGGRFQRRGAGAQRTQRTQRGEEKWGKVKENVKSHGGREGCLGTMVQGERNAFFVRKRQNWS